MFRRHTIDFDFIEMFPNKYNWDCKNIKKIKILDWEKLKKFTWYNPATNCYCHLEGCNDPRKMNDKFKYDDEDEFWIGFYGDGKVDFHFTSYGGMCGYEFKEFYKLKDMDNNFDLNVQINAIRYLNMLVEEGVIEKPC